MNIVIGTLVLFAVAAWMWRKLGTECRRVEALNRVRRMIITNLPRLMVALVSAGLFAELLPEDIVRRYLGDTSGMIGVLLGAGLGVLTPGGAFVAFALAAGAMTSGAAPAVMVAYIAAWALFALTKVITEEMAFLGPRFILTRAAISFPLPLIAGAICLLVS